MPSLWIITTFILYATSQVAAKRAQHQGPSYSTSHRPCQYDSECNVEKGEVCWWFYEGCPRGQCQCDPKSSYLDGDGFCRAVKMGGEACAPDDRCLDGMTCRLGICMCVIGEMTADHHYCVPIYSRTVGQNCEIGIHDCYQRTMSGYSPAEVSCTRGTCSCSEGFKELGGGCTTWLVGEQGCVKDHHCQGGALCVDHTCRCPSMYHPVAGNSKCARNGAATDVGVGDTCDEINERRYCARGLFCHRCFGDPYHTCVKYIEAETGRLINTASRAQLGSALTFVFAAILVWLLS